MDPAIIIALALGVPLGIGLVVLIVYLLRRWTEKVNRVWDDAAQRLGGTFDAKSGPWYNRTRRIDATVSGVPVVVDPYAVSTGQAVIYYTRMRAPVAAAAQLTLSIQRKGLLAKMGSALGLQDIPTGDAEFDESFVVKSNNEDLAQAWLTAEVREALMATNFYDFKLQKGELKAERTGIEEDPATLEAAARATGALAARGQQLHAWWGRVAEEGETSLQQRDDGGLRIEIDESGVPVQVDTRTERADGGTLTRVSARIVDASPERYELGPDSAPAEGLQSVDADRVDGLPDDYALCSSEPDRTARRFSSEQQQRITRLQPQRIVAADGEVRIDVGNLEGDEERLHEALELAADLAAQQDRSAYRG